MRYFFKAMNIEKYITLAKEKIPSPLDIFANKALALADPAHNKDHAIRVLANALYIIEHEKINLDTVSEWMLPFIMIGHDFMDHKLVEAKLTLSIDEIYEFYHKHLGRFMVSDVTHIQQNSSWSKRKSSIPLPGHRDNLRLLLQDSDWLDAIGEIGLQRCIDFTKFRHPDEKEDFIYKKVIQHAHEKLLQIPSNLNFDVSKKLAFELIKPIQKFVTDYEK